MFAQPPGTCCGAVVKLSSPDQLGSHSLLTVSPPQPASALAPLGAGVGAGPVCVSIHPDWEGGTGGRGTVTWCQAPAWLRPGSEDSSGAKIWEEERVRTGPWPSGRLEPCDGSEGNVASLRKRLPEKVPNLCSCVARPQHWPLVFAISWDRTGGGGGGLPIQLPCVLLIPATAPKTLLGKLPPQPCLQWPQVARTDLPASLGWP